MRIDGNYQQGYSGGQLYYRSRMETPLPGVTPQNNRRDPSEAPTTTEDKRANIVGAKDKATGGKLEPKQCETCASRRYQDASSDPNVSMKSPTRLVAGTEAGAVLSHEYEHLANRQREAEQKGEKVAFQTVRIFNSACPECGRVYVSGGRAITVTRPETALERNQDNQNKPQSSQLAAYQWWKSWPGLNGESYPKTGLDNLSPDNRIKSYRLDLIA